jgi:phage gp36-like protein
MPAYATREDVLRVLGGTERVAKEYFGRSLWLPPNPLTSVTVDGNTYDVPSTIIARIDDQLEVSDSVINGFILAAYKATPTTVPRHLTRSAAGMTAYHVLVSEGVKTQYVRDLHEEALMFQRALRDGKIDLGIPDPRPAHIAPYAEVRRGLGSTRVGGCRIKRGVY